MEVFFSLTPACGKKKNVPTIDSKTPVASGESFRQYMRTRALCRKLNNASTYVRDKGESREQRLGLRAASTIPYLAGQNVEARLGVYGRREHKLPLSGTYRIM